MLFWLQCLHPEPDNQHLLPLMLQWPPRWPSLSQSIPSRQNNTVKISHVTPLHNVDVFSLPFEQNLRSFHSAIQATFSRTHTALVSILLQGYSKPAHAPGSSLFFWLSQVFTDVCKLSLAVASRATLHRGAQASCCSPISCHRPQAPSAQAQSLQCSGLAAPPHVEYSGSRGQICVSYIDRRIIIHTVPPGKSLFQDLHTCSSLP